MRNSQKMLPLFLAIFKFYTTQRLFLFLTASATTLINIKNARKHFEQLERVENQSFVGR